MSSQQPLLEQESGTPPPPGWISERGKRYMIWTVFCILAAVLLIFIALKFFLFKSIVNGPPALTNETATEPNTKGPQNRPLSLIGLADYIYKIPIPTHPKVSICAIGLYVESSEGKRKLLKFQNKDVVNDPENFQKVLDILMKGGMNEVLRFVMAATPPPGRMLEYFRNNMMPELSKLCPDTAQDEFQAFTDFFPEAFKEKESFSFERRSEGELLYGYYGSDRMQAKKVGNSACLGKALFAGEIKQLPKLFDLVQNLFNEGQKKK